MWDKNRYSKLIIDAMAGNTSLFIRLKRRIASIETSYFPTLRVAGNYSDKEQDDIRAYLFLVHAELEYYFEEIARQKTDEALQKWIANRNYKSTILMSLSCFNKTAITTKKIRERLHIVKNSYYQIINNNHGIKEQNILDILLPLGIHIDDIDITWLNTISSFGSQRGDVAHQSSRVQSPLNPLDIKNNITLILQEIELLDKSIKKLK